jgi:hypothetical protein
MQTPLRAAMLAVLISCSSLVVADTKPEAKPAAAAPEMTPEQKAEMEAWAKMAAVRDEHKQLAWFAGNWTAKMSMWQDPKAPPQVSDAKTTSAAILGGRYIESHHEGSFMGQPYHGQGLFGFDNLKGKYFSTWNDDMSTGQWLAWGDYDAKTKTYTFHGDMDDPMKAGAKIPVREVVRVIDDKHYSFEWYETRGGKEAKTMQIEYSRQ